MSVDPLMEELARERQNQVRELSFAVSPYPHEAGLQIEFPLTKNSSTTLSVNRFELRAWAAQMIAYADELDATERVECASCKGEGALPAPGVPEPFVVCAECGGDGDVPPSR